MKDLVKENEYLKEEVEHLTQLLANVTEGSAASAAMWRESYFGLLKQFLSTLCRNAPCGEAGMWK
jgi:hypothetical protein